MRDPRFEIDPYNDGACVNQIDARGDIGTLVGWAQNHVAAVKVYEYLCRHEPRAGFVARVKSRVMGERRPLPPGQSLPEREHLSEPLFAVLDAAHDRGWSERDIIEAVEELGLAWRRRNRERRSKVISLTARMRKP